MAFFIMNAGPIHRLVFALVLLSALGVSQAARASTIFWGSEFDDLLFDSSGQPLSSDYSFELGSFSGGFTPTMANLDDWGTYWMVFDRAFDATPGDINDPDAEGWDSLNQVYAGTVDHTITGGSDSIDADPTDFFQQGTAIYLWVYNTRDRALGTAEWALVTDSINGNNSINGNDWAFPDPADTTGSYNLLLVDANEAIIGGVNSTTGGGQPYSLQTSLVPVPEPGSLFLLGAAAVGCLMRRRRIGPFFKNSDRTTH